MHLRGGLQSLSSALLTPVPWLDRYVVVSVKLPLACVVSGQLQNLDALGHTMLA